MSVGIPLTFWFPKVPDLDEIIDSYPHRNDICKRLDIVETLGLDQLRQLETDLIEFKNYVDGKRARMNFTMYSTFSKDFELIESRKSILLIQSDLFAYRYYTYPIKTTEDEIVNGYKLYNEQVKMDYDVFLNLVKRCIKQQPNDNKFKKWLNKHLCTDWCKQDRDGEPYGGFWKYDKGTYEYDNAYILSKKDNIKGLMKLLYPRNFIKWTINLGCRNRMESVRYTNFWCVWIDRTIKLTGVLNLQDMCKYIINCRHINNTNPLLFFMYTPPFLNLTNPGKNFYLFFWHHFCECSDAFVDAMVVFGHQVFDDLLRRLGIFVCVEENADPAGEFVVSTFVFSIFNNFHVEITEIVSELILDHGFSDLHISPRSFRVVTLQHSLIQTYVQSIFDGLFHLLLTRSSLLSSFLLFLFGFLFFCFRLWFSMGDRLGFGFGMGNLCWIELFWDESFRSTCENSLKLLLTLLQCESRDVDMSNHSVVIFISLFGLLSSKQILLIPLVCNVGHNLGNSGFQGFIDE